MEEIIIRAVLLLFTLSLITEKVSGFIKLNIASLRDKADTSDGEKKRESHIILLAAGIGIVVAFACKADFFAIIGEEPLRPWQKGDSVTLYQILGMLLTGLFLSQGSKFFHDLLDTLLYIKNIRRTVYETKDLEYSNLIAQSDTADTLIQKVIAADRDDEPDTNL